MRKGTTALLLAVLSSRRIPLGLLAVVLFDLAVGVAMLMSALRDTAIGIALGLLFVLFIPGYVLLILLVETSGTRRNTLVGDSERVRRQGDASLVERGSKWLAGKGEFAVSERFVLSIALSVAVSAGIGVLITVSPYQVGPRSIVLSVGGFTLLVTILAIISRIARSRPRHSDGSSLGATISTLTSPSTRTDALLNIVVALGIVVAAASVASVAVFQPSDDAYTSVQLLTENENTDELIVGGYPTRLAPDENEPVVLGITNQEHQRTEYTVVIEAQRVVSENNSTVVRDREQLDQFDIALNAGETNYTRYSISPTDVDKNATLRFAFLVYRGNAPDNPSIETAYQAVRMTVTVPAD